MSQLFTRTFLAQPEVNEIGAKPCSRAASLGDIDEDSTHVQFRSWCRYCVKGRRKEETCREARRSHDMAEAHMDFVFMGDEESEKTLAMLVVRERKWSNDVVDGGAEEEQRRMVRKKGDGVYAGSGM